MNPTQVADKRVVVMGLGRFGGGIAVTRWLVEQGARVVVTDAAPAEKLTTSLSQLEGLSVTFRLGGHEDVDLDACDLLVVSPAVPKERSPFVQEALRRRITITSEMNLFIERLVARTVVGITGTSGKSTTTAMLDTVLQEAVRAGRLPAIWTGGNIGKSLLFDLERITHSDIVVLELSSFQLEDLEALRWSPSMAVLTNIQPNHLDRHLTFEAYVNAKLNIVRFSEQAQQVFIHEDQQELCERVRAVARAGLIRHFRFDDRFRECLRVPGRHNEINAAAAIAVARALGVPDPVIGRGLQAFHGLPHRLELVAEIDGVNYYNDSKSTTPEATQIALEAFAQPVIVLVGGADKGVSFDALGQALAHRAKGVVCYGATGGALYEAVARHQSETPGRVHLERADSFDVAVRRARAMAGPGDVVVLSPACASYDMFTNYEQRGECFAELVLRASP